MITTKKNGAFTLMEIMLAVVIIGILVVILVPNIGRLMSRFQGNQAKILINTIKGGLNEYRIDVGRYPKRQEGGLNALIERPGKGTPVANKWKGPYLDKNEVPEDPWGQEFVYNCPPVRYKEYKMFEIYSLGPDQTESDDDIQDGV